MNGTSGIYRRRVKRVLDLVFCVLTVPLVLPLIVIIALVVRILA